MSFLSSGSFLLILSFHVDGSKVPWASFSPPCMGSGSGFDKPLGNIEPLPRDKWTIRCSPVPLVTSSLVSRSTLDLSATRHEGSRRVRPYVTVVTYSGGGHFASDANGSRVSLGAVPSNAPGVLPLVVFTSHSVGTSFTSWVPQRDPKDRHFGLPFVVSVH